MCRTQSARLFTAGIFIVCLSAIVTLTVFFRSENSSSTLAAKEPGHDPQRMEKPQLEKAQQPDLRMSRLPSRDDSDEELLRLARELVAQSPGRVVALAANETDSLFRERLLFAALRAWGEKNPQAAADWALAQDKEWRFKRMEAALTGAVAHPTVALEIGRKLLADDPNAGAAYATALVGALSRAGQFQAALQLASEPGVAEDVRHQWMDLTLRCWAEQQPQEALTALNSIQPEELRHALFQPLAIGWANHNPAELAKYASLLPASEARSFAFTQAMEQWLMRDPVSMAAWLNTLPVSAETDAAVALLMMRTDAVNRPIEVALSWVEQIHDLKLRNASLQHVLQEWAQTEPVAMREYLENVSWLTPAERQNVLLNIETAHRREGLSLDALRAAKLDPIEALRHE